MPKNRKIYIRKWFRGINRYIKCTDCGENTNSGRRIGWYRLNEINKGFYRGESYRVKNLINEGYSPYTIMKEMSKSVPLCQRCYMARVNMYISGN